MNQCFFLIIIPPSRKKRKLVTFFITDQLDHLIEIIFFYLYVLHDHSTSKASLIDQSLSYDALFF